MRLHTYAGTYVQRIHDALSPRGRARARVCVCTGLRCVKWANLYLSDIEYSYRGAVGTDKSVYSVRCVLTAPVIVPLGIWTTWPFSMHLGRLIGSHVDRARGIDRCCRGFPIAYQSPREACTLLGRPAGGSLLWESGGR